MRFITVCKITLLSIIFTACNSEAQPPIINNPTTPNEIKVDITTTIWKDLPAYMTLDDLVTQNNAQRQNGQILDATSYKAILSSEQLETFQNYYQGFPNYIVSQAQDGNWLFLEARYGVNDFESESKILVWDIEKEIVVDQSFIFMGMSADPMGGHNMSSTFEQEGSYIYIRNINGIASEGNIPFEHHDQITFNKKTGKFTSVRIDEE